MKSLILSLSILIVTISIKAQDSLFMQNQNGSISLGAGEWLIESRNNINSTGNLTLNLDIKIKKIFYLKIGGDILEHESYYIAKWFVYLGPDLKINVMHKKFDFTIDLGILGIAGSGHDGFGVGASLFLNPSFRYYIRNVSIGLELRNNFTSVYALNPLISFNYVF